MELHQLKTFAQVARDTSFSRAAQTLHLTQPAVSQQIRSLEQEMGVTLLQRTSRGIRLTRAGEILLEYAQNILSLADRGAAALAEFRTECRGRLILGAGNTTITFRLPPLLREYRRRQAGVEVIVRSGNSDQLLDLLERGQIDLALVTSPVEGHHFLATPLFGDAIILLLPKAHPLANRPSLAPGDLAGVPSILFARGSGFRQFLENRFVQAGYQPEVVMELDSIEGIKRLVQIGLGLSFLPEIAVEQELAVGDLSTVPVTGLTPITRTTQAVHQRVRFLPEPLKEFLSLLRENYPEKCR